MSRLYIVSSGDYIERIDAERAPADLKPLVAEATGTPVRRIDRFIQLALIACGRCARQLSLPADTTVYLASGRGDLEVTIELMENLIRDGHAPKPLSFINSVSNAACFYIAQSLKLMGRSSFVCNRYFAFESVLQLAALDMQTGATNHALIGTVDVVVPPLENHRIRVGLSADTPVGDASHWVCLQAQRPATEFSGEVVEAEHFVDADTLQLWLTSQSIDAGWVLATGQFMPAPEATTWQQQLGLDIFDYRTNRPYYDSQSGALIGEYVRSEEKRTLLHLNRDPGGRYSAMVVCKETE